MQLTSSPIPPDMTAIKDLYQKYSHSVLLYIQRYVPSHDDADDILLEVFLAALKHQTLHLRSEGEQLAWLRRVAHNKAIDHHRRTSPHRFVNLDKAHSLLSDEAKQPESVALQREEEDQLRAHLSSLPDQQQYILRLRYAHNLSTKEIAQKLNKSDGAIRITLLRTLNFLRSLYKQEGDA